ncbi:MAG: aspartate/glutamate racemase family protein [Thermoplasmatales archaeon]
MTRDRIYGGKNFYGYELGILMLNSRFPRGIGDVGNALSYDFPVIFHTVKTINIQNAVIKPNENLLEPLIIGAKSLEEIGVKAITTSCGFLVLYQDAIAKELTVPFFSSTLLLIPLIEKIVKNKILIITANSTSLGRNHFRAAGVKNYSRLIVKGLEGMPEFRRAILRDSQDMDRYKIGQEVIKVVADALNEDDNIGSILLECHNLPPYSERISREFGLPVFDFFSLVNLIHESFSKRRFI